MIRAFIILLAVSSGAAAAQDVFVPPVPTGIAREGTIRTPRAPIPFPSPKGRWIRVTAGPFDIISSATGEATSAIASDLQILASALTATSSRFETASERTPIFVFGNRRESAPYFDLLFRGERRLVTGAYVHHDGGGTMFIDGSHRGRIERTALHELVHDLLRQSGVAPPLWIEEGLAEYFSSAIIKSGRVLAGDPIRQHVLQLQRHHAMKVDEMFAVAAESAQAALPLFYARSWAAVDWLMAMGHEKFYPFLVDLERGASVAEALMRHYGKSIGDLEKALRSRTRAATRVTLTGLVTPPGPPRVLDRATLLYELGRFLSHVPGAEEESKRHFNAALAENPKHAPTLAAIGELDAALDAAPDDAEIHLLYAESLLTTALGSFAGVFAPEEGDTERFRRARQLAERAGSLGGHPGRAAGIIGTSYLVESDPRLGITHLEQARAGLPQRMDYALNLYAMYLRSGDRERAAALFDSTFAHSPDRQTAFAARSVLLSVTAARANELTRRGKLDEAAALVRELADATEDPNAGRELREEAGKLEGIAAVNRQILTYNEAVAMSNSGRRAEAARILDELLKVATDPELVQDARELREQLRKK